MGDEQSRPFANNDEHGYALTIEETAERYARAGLPRTHRAIQKYCAASKLDCRKVETELGEKYLVAPYSIDRHIAYIKSVTPRSGDASVREEPRTDANVPPPPREAEQPRTETNDRYTAALERENDLLRRQLEVKDAQIKDYADRSRETNILMQSFQRLLGPLLGSGDRDTGTTHQAE